MPPYSPDIIMQENLESTESTESEQNPLVNCLHHVFLAGADDLQIQHPGPGFIASAQNVLITGGTFVSLL